MKYIVSLICTIIWIAGIIVAKGFWSTFFAVIVPFWAWYLIIEKVIAQYIH